MDAIDNLIFATTQPTISPAIASPYLGGLAYGLVNTPPYFFALRDKEDFVCFPDSELIEEAIRKHWFEIGAGINYTWPFVVAPAPQTQVLNLQDPPYHLIYSYVLESTHIIPLIRKLLTMYFNDEELGIAVNPNALQWMVNTEKIFFKTDSWNSLRSQIRPDIDITRKNAYDRLFGLGLPFQDEGSHAKPKVANNTFTMLFEQYLAEVWQGYINATNTSGPNTTDTINIVNLGDKLRELLNNRRGSTRETPHVFRNLSYEEYYSVMLLSWLSFVFTYDSPLVTFLRCEASTFGDRLAKLGMKIGVPIHKKSQSLFEMAGPLANILLTIESNLVLNNAVNVGLMLGRAPALVGLMSDFLTVINNWEKATGHKIKNREANITGTVRVAQLARGTLVTN